MVLAELRHHYFVILRVFFGTHATDLHELLRSHDAIISGSTALAFLTWPDTWSPGDLDIYVANDAYPRFIQELEKGHLAFFEADFGVRSPSAYHGIATVRRYFTIRGECLDVIQSSTGNAAHPLLYFWSSLVVNVLGPSGALCLYPGRTLNSSALVADISRTEKLVEARKKYEARGFKFTDVASWKPISPVDDQGNLILSDSPALLIDFQAMWSENSCRMPVDHAGANWVLSPDKSGLISGQKI